MRPIRESGASSSFFSEGSVSLDLINSFYSDHRGSGLFFDDLDNSAWLIAFLTHWRLTAECPPDALAKAMLVTLRALMREMMESIVQGGSPGDLAIAELNNFMALAPATRRLQRVEVTLRIAPDLTGWPVIATFAAESLAFLLTETPAARFKQCANPDCNWLFIDHSHNSSRRWCREWACGNLIKVRRFRERAKSLKTHLTQLAGDIASEE
jgi:predicted RNA-binding Zn ribbon-like protein